MEQAIALAGIMVTSFAVALSGAVMPGPLLAVTIRESLRRGWVAGPLLMLGHAALEAVLVGAVALGFAAFLQRPGVTIAAACAGGATMCWMGFGAVRSARAMSLRAGHEPAGGMHPVLAGALVSLSNPYWIIWWITVGIAYIAAGLRYGPAGVAVFFAGHILADLAWYTFVSTAVARGGKLLPDRVFRGAIAACGAALAVFGVWFLASGLGALGAV